MKGLKMKLIALALLCLPLCGCAATAIWGGADNMTNKLLNVEAGTATTDGVNLAQMNASNDLQDVVMDGLTAQSNTWNGAVWTNHTGEVSVNGFALPEVDFPLKIVIGDQYQAAGTYYFTAVVNGYPQYNLTGNFLQYADPAIQHAEGYWKIFHNYAVGGPEYYHKAESDAVSVPGYGEWEADTDGTNSPYASDFIAAVDVGIAGSTNFVIECADATKDIHALNRQTGNGLYLLQADGLFITNIFYTTGAAGTGIITNDVVLWAESWTTNGVSL